MRKTPGLVTILMLERGKMLNAGGFFWGGGEHWKESTGSEGGSLVKTGVGNNKVGGAAGFMPLEGTAANANTLQKMSLNGHKWYVGVTREALRVNTQRANLREREAKGTFNFFLVCHLRPQEHWKCH